MYENVELEGSNIVLKKACFEDWKDLYFNVWRHVETARNMLWMPTVSEDEAQDRMRRTIEFQKKEKYALDIYEKKTMKAIGWAGMKEVEPLVYEEMGIVVGPEYSGRGYGKEALLLLLKEAFENCNAETFNAYCRTTNLVSHNLQMSAGFEFDSTEDKVDERDMSAFSFEDMEPYGNGQAYILEHNILTRKKYKSIYGNI